jgi:transcriptional regulator with XRE-family HTH domain
MPCGQRVCQVGVKEATVSRWERDEHPPRPLRPKLVAISRVTTKPLSFFLPGESDDRGDHQQVGDTSVAVATRRISEHERRLALLEVAQLERSQVLAALARRIDELTDELQRLSDAADARVRGSRAGRADRSS